MEAYQVFTIVVSFLGAILGGALIPWIISKKDRESREQIFEDEKQHKIKLFELEKKHKEEMYELEKNERKESYDLATKDKFRLVAIDKRLETHQMALKYWYKLRDIIHSTDEDKRKAIINEAFEFWYSNCLYLETETRDKFYKAIAITDMHNQNKKMYQESRSPEIREIINKNWDDFMETHGIIFKEVELEPIVPKVGTEGAFGNDIQDER